jgi:hypothetical protein
MHADDGSLPFETWAHSDVVPDLDRINPAYFAMLDRKVQYLSNHGFVAFLETVRRDHGPAWKSYFDWPGSFARYVQYIVARYGAYSIIFSGIHLDWIHPVFCLPPSEFNAALSWHHATYGPLPFGQPHTTLIDRSTYRQFGHGSDAPWLTMHAVGNYPRNHSVTPLIEEMFRLSPPYPIANLEPYYPGWPGSRQVADEQPGMNSERDNYFARAQMYGSILSGGLAGHMYGSGAYSGTTTGEPRESGDRPYIWEALRYPSGGQMQHLAAFVFSVGPAYQRLVPARELLVPNTADNAPEDGLDGWSFMLRDPNGEHALLYFEQQAPMPRIGGLRPHRDYRLCWFNPVDGNWLDALVAMPADGDGTLRPSRFPDGAETSARRDWCLQLTLCT